MNGSNRYTNLSFSNLRDLPKLQVPYEQLDELLNKYEEKAKETKTMIGIKPNYLEDSKGDVELAKYVMGYQSDMKKKLAEIAKEGNVKKYMQGLDEAQSAIKELYSPGGAGYTLQSRYMAYQKEKEKILESTKDYTNPLYPKYYFKQLKQQLEKTKTAGDVYDMALKKGTQINPISLTKEVIIPKEADEYFKKWASDRGVEYDKLFINGQVNPEYIVQITTEQVTKEELEEAIKSFYDRPDIKHALEIEVSNMEDIVTPEQQDVIVENSKEKAKAKNELLKKELEQRLNNLEKLGEKEQKITLKEYNQILSKNFTKIEELKTYLRNAMTKKTEELEASLENLSFSDVALDEIKGKYTDAYVTKYSFTKVDEKVIKNNAYLTRLKADTLRTLIQEFAPPDPVLLSETDVKTTTIDNFSTQFQKNHENFNETQTTLNKNSSVEYITGQLKNAGYSGTILTYDIAKQLKEAYTSNLSEEGNLNKEGFKQAINNLNLDGDKVVELISKEPVRNNLNSFINDLEPSYLNKQHSIDAAIRLIDEASQEELERMMKYISSGDLKFLDKNIKAYPAPTQYPVGPAVISPFAIFQQDNMVFTKPNISGSEIPLDKEDMKRNLKIQIRNGNSKILKELDKEKEIKSSVVTISTTALAESNETLAKGINTGLEAMIAANISSLDKDSLKALGYDEELNRIEDAKTGFKSATIAIDDVDGKKQIVISGTTHTGESVILTPQTIQEGFLKNQLLQVIGATINEEGNIKDETTYNTLLPVYFDGVVNSSGLSVDNISRNIELNNFNSNVGRFNANVVNSDIIVKLIKTEYGDNMLVSYPATYESKFEKAKDRDTFNMSKFMNSLDSNEKKFIETAKIDSPSYNDVNKGISRIKIEWAKPLIQKETGNSFKVKTSSAIQSSIVDEFRIIEKLLMDSE